MSNAQNDTYDVYIAGAMTGRTVGEVLKERNIVKAVLWAHNLTWYDPADDENLEALDETTIIANQFNLEEMTGFVKKDLGAISRCKCVLNISGDVMSDGAAWEMAFAVYHRQIPVYIIAPKRFAKEKMGFTNILVDGIFPTLEEATCHIAKEALLQA